MEPKTLWKTNMELSRYTTLELGGAARRFVSATRESDLVAIISDCDARGEPVFVLGGGSNVVFADAGFDGTVVHVATRGIVTGDELEIAAGEPWDDFVAWSVRSGLAGVECLSGIPGLVGATPIQNVGAYGQEVKDTIASVRVWDRETSQIVSLSNEACRFSYRHSMLKESPRWVVLRVRFALAKSVQSTRIRYAELARAVGGETAPLARVREAVIALRKGKGMVLDPNDADTRSAGSFFVNPTMDEAAYAALAARAGESVPRFPSDDGRVKVPAAWLIEHAGFAKGTARGRVAISSKHALALTNRGGATAGELLALAREIQGGVFARFGVTLVPEPVLVGSAL
ncbi:MAG TPA: UDP-N-acetylmuramate dehydrogenase [Polyangiaceae bacterium]